MAQYSDPKIKVESQKKLNEKYTMVSSVLIATEDKPEIKIDWRVVTKNINQPLNKRLDNRRIKPRKNP